MNQGSTAALEFPCEFPIKAIGHASDDFDAKVFALVRRHAPDLAEGAVRSRQSGGGKYLSVTVTILAQSQLQLDSIYRELSGNPDILMVL